MEATAWRRSFENLGLQLLFAQVRSLIGAEIPQELPSTERQALVDLSKFLDTVIAGLQLINRRRETGYGSLGTLNDSVKAERAYRTMHQVLPPDPKKAEALLNELKETCQQILKGKHPKQKNRQDLHSFSRSVLSYLDRERFESLRDPQNLWP